MATRQRTASRTAEPPQLQLAKDGHAAELAELRAENGRLCEENARLASELANSLEQQTATSQVLQTISRSAFDLPTVLQTLVDTAAKLCGANNAGIFRVVDDVLHADTFYWDPQEGQPQDLTKAYLDYRGPVRKIDRGNLPGRAAFERGPVWIDDPATDPDLDEPFRDDYVQHGLHTGVGVPLLKDNKVVGSFALWRKAPLEPCPFSERDVQLLQTFADRAVIAIENARLVNALQEALEQQTATGKVLQTISRSAFDLDALLQTLVESAARLCDASFVNIHLAQGGYFSGVLAAFGVLSEQQRAVLRDFKVAVGDRGSLVGRMGAQMRPVQVSDVLADPEYHVGNPRPMDFRSGLAVPLLSNDALAGAFFLARTDVRPFTERQIELATTFADQAVIALENSRLVSELRESLEQQTATAEILSVISQSPTNAQPVLDTVLEHAARLCEAADVRLVIREGDQARHVATRGHWDVDAAPAAPGPASAWLTNLARRSAPGQAMRDGRTLRISDFQDPSMTAEYPESLPYVKATNTRSMLCVPLMRDGNAVGVVIASRQEPTPFSDQHARLLETFADQAVIAIENVRLFTELEQRTKDLQESLEQQTATSEVLQTISRSAFDLAAVLQTLVDSAVHLCGADGGTIYRAYGDTYQFECASMSGFGVDAGEVANFKSVLRGRLPDRGTVAGRAASERRMINIADAQTDPDFSQEFLAASKRHGTHGHLGVPMFRGDELLGVFVMLRKQAEPFSPRQIDLVKTFADQAVIAIENARLVNELRESLEQQTATADILGVISQSPTDVQPVLDAIVDRAARICETDQVVIFLAQGDELVHMAGVEVARIGRRDRLPIRREASVVARAFLDRQVIVVDDMATLPEDEYPGAAERARERGQRSFIWVPLMHKDSAVGVLNVFRKEVRPFTERQVELLQTFADQAVIAIENVRLFTELQQRTNDLQEALEQQTATSEVLQTISRSAFDLDAVLDALTESAVKLTGSSKGVITRFEGDHYRHTAGFGFSEAGVRSLEATPLRPLDNGSIAGRVGLTRDIVQVLDVLADRNVSEPIRGVSEMNEIRTALGVPLEREGMPIGVIVLFKTVVEAFTERQIELVKTFADQAVIAIENARLLRELQEALEQQTATAEILGVISHSPTDIQPVLEAIAERALALCEASDGAVFLAEGDHYRRAVALGRIKMAVNPGLSPIRRTGFPGRLMLERRMLRADDAQLAILDDYPDSAASVRAHGLRSTLGVPLLRDDTALGAIMVMRDEVRPFSDKHASLLETFADQAVIAIENVRLFTELQQRTKDLQEALEQQTATSEVLQTISRSAFDLDAVLQTLVTNARSLCHADWSNIFMLEGEVFRSRATFGDIQGDYSLVSGRPLRAASRDSLTGRVSLERQTLQIEDIEADQELGADSLAMVAQAGIRSALGVPLLREGQVIGVFILGRKVVGPYGDQETKLVETFADQAVIAIENSRLLGELQESLEQQTATADILSVISQSPTNIQPVLDALLERATALCKATDGGIMLVEGDAFYLRAQKVNKRPRRLVPQMASRSPLRQGSPAGRAVRDRAVVHIPDVSLASNAEMDARAREVMRASQTILCVPLLHEEEAIGVILLHRVQVQPFSEREIELVKTFADQAVIAIENVRLFTELQRRTQDLQEALEQQTATGQVLQTISRSAFDLLAVLETLIESAARLCRADQAVIYRAEGGALRAMASHGFPRRVAQAFERDPLRALDDTTVAGRTALERRVIQIEDVRKLPRSHVTPVRRLAGNRTGLGVPLLREGALVGAFALFRKEVRLFSDKEIELVQTFADQAVIAIENARLVSELQESLEQQTATAEILSVISRSPTNIQPVLDAIVEQAARLCDTQRVSIFLAQEGALVQMAGAGLASRSRLAIRPEESVVARAFIEQKAIVVDDMSALPEAEYPGTAERARQLGQRSNAWIPLIRHGVAVGVLTLGRTDVRPFTQRQVDLLKTFADQAVIAIENVRLFTELQRRTEELSKSVERLQALGEVGQAVSSTLDLQQVLTTIIARAVRLAGADNGTIYEVTADGRGLARRATEGLDDRTAQRLEGLGAVASHAQTFVGQAIARRQPLQAPDIMDESAANSELYTSSENVRNVYGQLGIRAALAVPLIREDEALGAIVLRRKTSGEFAPETVELLRTLASQSAIAIQNARLYAELERKSLELEVASQHKSQFLANMSHELRTPLNAIIGFSEMLSKQMLGELTAEQLDVVQDVLSSGRHLLALINDILDLSKVEAGRMELDVSSFSVPEVLGMALTMVRERAASHGIQLKLEVGPGIEDIEADERKIKQVLVNLLSNAVKFTSDGGSVAVRARRPEFRIQNSEFRDFVEISVTDSGIGIAPEDRAKVFEEFEQVGTAEAVKKEGTGLGLPLAKRFVELHGGQMWLQSQLGHGSTFAFTLPLRQAAGVSS